MGVGFEAIDAGGVRVAVHRDGARPDLGLNDFDVLLSADHAAPTPWVGLGAARLPDAVARLLATIRRQPVAATVAAQILRVSLKLSFDEAVIAESTAYSMLLASAGFRTWRAATPIRRRDDDDAQRVSLSHEGGALHIRLTRPAMRNAVDSRMRDELAEALRFAAADPDVSPVVLSGEGPAFCAGGDLDTFGQAIDVAVAHEVRVLQSAATLTHALGSRATARLHGACVGAGVEIPAAAHRVLARPGAFFQLPEVSMGLIPGAGGTASIPRRIGRQRACWLAISGERLDVGAALAWGLIDGLDEPVKPGPGLRRPSANSRSSAG